MKRDYSYTVTSGSSSNVSVTWTNWHQRARHAHADAGWWGVLDALGHELNLPKKLQRIICDRFEIAVGIPRTDLVAMDYDGKAPWWLRR